MVQNRLQNLLNNQIKFSEEEIDTLISETSKYKTLSELGNTKIPESFGYSELQKDVENLGTKNFIDKYGSNLAENRNLLFNYDDTISDDYFKDTGALRSIGDFLTGATGSAISGTVGLGSLIASGIERTGRAITSEKNQIKSNLSLTKPFAKVEETVKSIQDSLLSEESLKNREARSSISQMRKEESKREREDAGIRDRLRSYGKQAVKGITSSITDEGALLELGASAVGSLIPSAGLVSGANKIAKATNLGKKGTRAAQGTALGLLGSSEASKSAYETIMNTSISDLSDNSPEFNELITSGFEPEKAREVLAVESGTTAAGITFPVNVLLGTFANKLPKNLSGFSATRDGVKEIVGEGLEEVTSNIGSDIGVKIEALPEQSIGDTAATAFGQGVVGGGIITVGGATLNSPIRVKKFSQERLANLKEQRENNAVTGDKAFTEENQILKESVNNVSNNVDLPIDIKEGLESINRPLDKEANLSENLINSLDIDENNNINVFESLKNISNKLDNNEFTDKDEKLQAELFLFKKLSDIDNFNDYIQNNVEQSENNQFLFDIQNQLINLADKEVVQNIIQRQDEIQQSPLPPNLILNQKIVEDTVDIAKINPLGADLDTLRAIDNSEIQINEDDQKAIDFALAVNNASAQSQEINKTDRDKDIDSVKKQILIGGGDKYSISEYVSLISRGIKSGSVIDRDGNKVNTQDVVNAFKDFVTHMRNKADAVNRATKVDRDKDNIGKVFFDTLKSTGEFIPAGESGSKDVFLKYDSNGNLNSGSERLAQNVFADAYTGINIYNRLVDSYGDKFNLEKINRPAIPQELQNSKLAEIFKKQPEFKKKKETVKTEKKVEPNKKENKPVEKKKVETKVKEKPLTVKEKIIKEEQTLEEFSKIKQDLKEEPVNYKNLVNRTFQESFLDKKEGIKLSEINNKLNNINLITETNYKVEDKKVKIIKASLRDKFKQFDNHFKDRLNLVVSIKKGGKKQTIIDHAKEDIENISGLKQFRILALLDKDTYTINNDLLSKATLAYVDWALKVSQKQNSKFTDNDIIGDIENNQFDLSDLKKIYSENNAQEDLGKNILKFWGVKENPDASLSNSRFLAEELAAELLISEKNVDPNKQLFENKKIQIDSTNLNKKLGILNFNNNIVENIKNELGDHYNLLSDLIKEYEDVIYSIGKPIKEISDVQLNSNNKLTELNKKTIKAEQNTKYYRNDNFVELANALGEDNLNSLFGSIKIDNENNYNIGDLSTIKGKNETNKLNWETLQNLNQSLNKEKDPSNTPVFFKGGISRVNRIQMAFGGPQSNKVMREAFKPNASTIDLTNQKDIDNLWLTFAQGSELVKIENMYKSNAIKKAKKDIYEEYGDAIVELKNYVKTGKLNAENIVNNINEIIEPVTLNTLLELARFEVAIENGDKTFKTFSTMEADGKTNGIMNFLMNFSTGKFTLKFLNYVQKAGIYFGKENQTLNDYVEKYDNKDIYTGLGEIFTTNLNKEKKYLLNQFQSKKDKLLINWLYKLNALYGDIEVTDGNNNYLTNKLEATRKAIKNPLTVFIYGSGEKGISDTVTNKITAGLEKEMSNLLQGKPGENFKNEQELFAVINLITNNKLIFSKKKNKHFIINSQNKFNNKTLKDFRFRDNKILFDNLSTNIRETYVKPLRESFKSEFGDSLSAFNLIKTVTQFQSLLARDIFKYNEKLELQNYREDTESTNLFLSPKRRNKVLKSVKNLQPIYKTKDINLNMASSEKGESEFKLSAGIKGEYNSNSQLEYPVNVGVKSQPFINIGTGDALMMQPFKANYKIAERGVTVHDGVYFGVTDLEEGSNKINQAVYESFLTNKITPVLNSFTDFKNELKNYKNLDGIISEETREWLNNNILEKEPFYQDFIFEKTANIYLDRLNYLNNSAQNRIETMKKLGMSIDHMAGASSPYSTKGKTFDFNNQQALLDNLNEEYNKNLNVFNEVVDPNDVKYIKEDLKKLTIKDIEKRNKIKENNAIKSYQKELFPKIKIKELNKIKEKERKNFPNIKSFNEISARKAISYFLEQQFFNENQGKLLFSIRNKLKNTKIAYDLSNNYIEKNYPHLKNVDIGEGFISLQDNTIFLNNLSGETILHECIHAAVATDIYNYYNNDIAKTLPESRAINNLEKLMKEFLYYDFTVSNKAIDNLKNIINSNLKENTTEGKVVALNEFLAWTLSNRKLQLETKNVKLNDKLKSILLRSYQFLKQLIGFKNTLPDNLFDAIRFNFDLLVQNPINVNNNVRPTLQLHQKIDVKNKRVEAIINKYSSLLYKNINLSKPKPNLTIKTNRILNKLEAAGFNFSIGEKKSIEAIIGVTNYDYGINKKGYADLQKVYVTLLNKLTVEDFLQNPKVDDPNDQSQAVDKYKAVFDIKNEESIEDQLGTILGLGYLSKEFRNIIKDIKIDKLEEKYTNLDEILTTTANKAIHSIDPLSENLDDAFVEIIDNVFKQDFDSQRELTNKVQKSINNLDDKIVETISKNVDKLAQSENKIIETGASFIKTIFDKSLYQDKAFRFLNKNNKIPLEIKELFKEFVGKTPDSRVIENMMNKVKSFLDQTKQKYKQEIPKILNAKFKTEPTKEQWKSLTNILGKTDLFALGSSKTISETISIIKNKNKLDSEINKLEQNIESLDKSNAKLILRKSKQLANFMINGTANSNLLRNAYAIASLLNEKNKLQTEPSEELINSIDELVSLYAYELSSDLDKNNLKELIKTDRKAIEEVGGYLKQINVQERGKTDKFNYNTYKGYLPFSVKDGVKLIIADDSEQIKLEEQGFTRIGNYTKPSNDVSTKKFGYYYSNTVGATYQQGVMQTVQNSLFGIDPVTGKTLSGKTSGSLLSGSVVKSINSKIEKDGENNFLPIFNDKGKLVAYERSLSPRMLNKLKAENELQNIISSWRGRQIEEQVAQEYNKSLVDNINNLYQQDIKKGREEEYINIADSKDKIHEDIWNVIPFDTKLHIEKVFGEEKFMVRKDLLNNALGYRLVSVGDIFTGKTRYSEKTTKIARDISKLFLGNNAYRKLLMAERGLQTVVSNIKDLIVVKSIIVPTLNILSNVVHLLRVGVSPVNMYRDSKKILREITQYEKNEKRKIEIEVELFINIDKLQKSRLKKELESIEKINSQMSIKPLIDAGEFNTISEGLTDLDASLTESNWGEWIENKVSKLPSGIKEIGRYGIITKDTSLYQGLNKMTQYGDFFAKVILYNDLINNKKQSKEKALEKVSEEFVNYNFLAGRTRSYLDSIGLFWFWNYKIRIQKVAFNTMLNNPFKILFGNLVGSQLPDVGIGSPITDNFISSAVDGKLKYSVGFDMLLSAPTANPWANIVN